MFVEPAPGWDGDAGPGVQVVGRDAVRTTEPEAVRAGQPAIVPLRHPDARAMIDAARSRGAEPWAEVGDLPSLRAAAAAGANLWLRGLEAGGPCGEVGATVLIRAARATGRPFVVQGLGRRAMAAAIAVGAAGVVLDVHTWALEDSPLHPEHRAWLVGRSGRDTSILDGSRVGRGTVVSASWSTDPSSALPCPTCPGEAQPGPPLAEYVSRLREELASRVARVRAHHPLRGDPFGTGRCVVQGPMANVSERPELARAVLESGGLPFCALGALRPDAARAVLDGMAGLDGPWGAGVIGFDVMPWRDAHLAAIYATGPRRVILAGGSPALAAALVERGHEPWLHTPSARLARMALQRGLPAVVLEGREAGGHVGALPSSALWEEALAEIEGLPPALVVLAGGIGDAVSAAFAGAMACDAHAAGHRIAIQVGTALFFTHEIVEAGQITRTYQQAALAAERTVAVGETVNLPLQCAPNAFTDAAIADERRWLAEGLPLAERRERVERHNLGRTRLAARGIERDGQGGYRPVPVARQRDDGAYTLGQGALATRELQTVDALIRSLTDDAAALLEGFGPGRERWGPALAVIGDPRPQPLRPPAAQRVDDAPIAIVGIGAVLPGAHGVPAFWELLVHGLDAIRPIPPERWLASRYFHPDADGTRTSTRMAGVIEGFAFDPLAYGIPPRVAASMDRAQQLALVAAAEAIRGVRISDRRRAAVIVGNSMGGEHAKSLAVRVRFREVLAALDAEGALPSGDARAEIADRVEDRLDESLPPVDVESMSGLLANVIAGRVASWLDLMGGNLTVDAACAASLAAVAVAVDQLRAGRVDLVLTGGVDADLAPETFVGFDRTHALSATGSQPFSAHADGFVMGEGAAMLVLKRLTDAIADGDPIWAVIREVGQSSDGRSTGITAPRIEGQELAIRRAYDGSGFGPEAVEMVEAHGTGTAVGDRTELAALARVFGPHRAALGSVKSQIGHLKGAAGAAGLLKAALSIAHRRIPPTLHAAPLRAGLSDGPFRLPRGPLRFEQAVARASVSAFGFGGTNYHVLLEAPPEGAHRPLELPTPAIPPALWERPVPRVRLFGAATPDALIQAWRNGHTRTPEEVAAYPERLVVLDDPPGLDAWLDRGASGRFGRSAWRYSGAATPAVLVFPGQGSAREHADAALRRLVAGRRALDALGVGSLDTSADPAAQHHLLVATGSAWAAALAGLPRAGVIGHSVGELAALVAAGRLSAADALALADARGRALGACPPGAMLAVALDADAAASLGAACGLQVAARNGPSATVLAGAPDAARQGLSLARERQVRAALLDVERAFHTPDVQPAADALRAALDRVTLHAGDRWWSNVSDDLPVGEALVAGVTAPVGFLDAVARAAADGHRLFVHVGPGAALVPHIQAAVPDAIVVALDPAPSADASGIVPAAAELAALGHPTLLRALPGTLVALPFPLAPPVAEHVPARPRPPASRPSRDARSSPQRSPTPRAAVEPATGVRAVLLAAISEVTGYPPEAIPPGAALDRDLGIDSIRKMEILGLVQDRTGRAVDDAALAALGTVDLDGLVAFLEDGAPPPAEPIARGTAERWTRLLVPDDASPGDQPERWTPVPDLPLPALLAPWLAEGTRSGPLALDPTLPAHHGLDALLRVREREGGAPIARRWIGAAGPLRWARARALDAAPLPVRPVVLASGGTTGILGPCLAALPGARGVVLGRRPDGDPPPGFTYVPCDLTDADAVRAAAAACRTEHGRIDMVIHAAGALRDGPLATRTAEDLDVALAAKWRGALHLIDATREDHPAIWAPFSSVAAALGNPGQSLYAAANAALEALVHPTAARSVPLVWTAWSEVGMASDPALQRLLRARGIDAVSPAEGSALFVDALRGGGRQWLAREAPPDPPLPWPLTATDGAGTFAVALDPDSPELRDHRVGGRALVPAALWVGALIRARRVLAPGEPTCLRDLEVLSPTFVREPLEARIALADDGTARVMRGEHVVCVARFGPAPSTSAPTSALDGGALGPLYGGLLFHGPAWQMLREPRVVGDRAQARVQLDGTDPLAALVDGAHQLLAAWSGHATGALGLPVGAGAWAFAGAIPAGALALDLVAHRTPDGAVADVVATGPDGDAVAWGERVRLRDAGRWGADA